MARRCHRGICPKFVIRIEFEPATISTCECCEAVTTRLTRFVYEDDDAYAIYYVCLSDNHPNDVKVAVSVGVWWEGGTPADRTAFALRLWQDEKQFSVTVEDASASPWRSVQLIGRMLNRSEALEHPRLRDVFHLTDHMFAEDPEIKAFFARANP